MLGTPLPLLLLAASVASAYEVSVDDPQACLDEESLFLELQDVLPPELSQEVQVAATMPSGASPWTLELTLHDGGELLLVRSLEVVPADCAWLPVLVARSIERGLAELPGWSLVAPERDRLVEVGLDLGLSFGSRLDPRGRFGASAAFGFGPSFRIVSHLQGYWSGVETFGDAGAQFLGVELGVGPGLDLRIAGTSVRADAWVATGRMIVLGRGLDRTEVGGSFRSTVGGDLVLFSEGMVRVGPWIEVPLQPVPYFYETEGGQQVRTTEAPVRAGVRITLVAFRRSR